MCARTQFMTDSFLWAERPIMSKTNETMKHNAEAAQFHPGQPSSHRQSQDKCTDHGSCKVQLAPTTVCRRTFYLSLTSIPPISNPYHRIFSDKPFYMFLSFLLALASFGKDSPVNTNLILFKYGMECLQ